MSLWARFFSRKQLQVFEKLQNELELACKKSQATFAVLAGLTGKIKGMDIANAGLDDSNKHPYDKKDVRGIVAKGVELYLRFSLLEFMPESSEKVLRTIQFEYGPGDIFNIYPVPGNEHFAFITLNANSVKFLSSMEKLTALLNELRPERPPAEDD